VTLHLLRVSIHNLVDICLAVVGEAKLVAEAVHDHVDLALRGAVEAAAQRREQPHDGGVRITLNRVEGLHHGQFLVPLVELLDDGGQVRDQEGIFVFFGGHFVLNQSWHGAERAYVINRRVEEAREALVGFGGLAGRHTLLNVLLHAGGGPPRLERAAQREEVAVELHIRELGCFVICYKRACLLTALVKLSLVYGV